jgi:hypothetical protein
MYVIKTDSTGVCEWEATFGGAYDDIAFSLLQTSDGGYVIAGSTRSYAAEKMGILIKIDATGNLIWQQLYDAVPLHITIRSVLNGIDGGYMLAGYTFATFEQEYLLIKTDDEGEVIWQRTYEVPGPSPGFTFNSAAMTSDSCCLMVGSDRVHRHYVMKLDYNGDIVWAHSYGVGYPPWANEVTSIIELTSTRYAFSGEEYYCEPPYWWQGILSLITDEGNLIWTKAYYFPGSGYSSLRSIAPKQYSEPGLISAGQDGSDAYFVNVNVTTGNEIWAMTFGGTGGEQALSIIEIGGGSYVATGYTDSWGAGGNDVLLVEIGFQTGMTPESPGSENGFSLQTIHPNPFASELSIEFELDTASDILLRVYDIAGHLVSELVNCHLLSGSHLYHWSPESELPNGCYSVVLDAEGSRSVQRCIRLR